VVTPAPPSSPPHIWRTYDVGLRCMETFLFSSPFGKTEGRKTPGTRLNIQPRCCGEVFFLFLLCVSECMGGWGILVFLVFWVLFFFLFVFFVCFFVCWVFALILMVARILAIQARSPLILYGMGNSQWLCECPLVAVLSPFLFPPC